MSSPRPLAFLGLLGVSILAAFGLASKADATTSPAARFRKALVEVALRDVGQIKESGGKNRGPEVDKILAEVGRAPGQNWCAAMLSRWVRRAAQLIGLEPPFVGNAGAKETFARAVKAGHLVKPQNMSPETCPPGTIVGWDRSNPPWSSWEGHIGVLTQWTSPALFKCAEGNSGPTGETADLMDRSKNDSRLLGGAVVSDPEALGTHIT